MATATTFTRSLNELTSSVKTANHAVHPVTRLVKFFSRYPPSQYSAFATGQAIPTSKQRVEMGDGAKPLSSMNVPQASSLPNSQSTDVDAEINMNEVNDEGFAGMIAEEQVSRARVKVDGAQREQTPKFPPNPFLPYKNPETGRWRGARFGLREQADLFRYARELEMEELLPASIKSSVYKQQRILERGLAVRGTGEGQRVKGHKWERQRASTLEKRRKAMEEMPALIREWEQKGHGRGWKKYPR